MSAFLRYRNANGKSTRTANLHASREGSAVFAKTNDPLSPGDLPPKQRCRIYLEQQPDHWFIAPLNNATILRVQDRAIAEPTRLHDEDSIQLGETRFIFKLSATVEHPVVTDPLEPAHPAAPAPSPSPAVHAAVVGGVAEELQSKNRQEVEALEQRVVQLDADLRKLKERLELERQSHRETKDELRQKAEEARGFAATASELRHERTKEQETHKEAVAALQGVRQQLDAAQILLATCRDQHRAEQNLLREERKRAKDLQTELNLKSAENAVLIKNQEALHEQIERKGKLVEEISKLLEDQKRSLVPFERDLREARQQLQQLRADNDRQSKELASAQLQAGEIADLKRRLAQALRGGAPPAPTVLPLPLEEDARQASAAAAQAILDVQVQLVDALDRLEKLPPVAVVGTSGHTALTQARDALTLALERARLARDIVSQLRLRSSPRP